MCGIAGEFRFDGRPVDCAQIVAMTDALHHRGPDDAGLYCAGPIGLGHRRLSIIDLSPNGRQPMWNAAGTLAIIFNGEIYNYREIRAELQREGRAFRTESDTEVLIEAIERWGIEDTLRRAIGMFAFVVWNDRSRTLTLCRDRVGVKPLYYSLTPSRLLFASELKGLAAHAGFNRRADLTAIGQALVVGYAIGAATPFADARRIPAGHYLVVDAAGRVTTHEYWSLDAIERGSFRGTIDEALDELLALCESAFAYRLVADVPVGLFQSGGVDSALVAAVLRKRVGADIQSITIGFKDEQYDETARAQAIAQSLGVRHIVHRVEPDEAQEVLARFVEIFDEPFGDTSGMPTYILAKIARQYVKVALSADGGDEQFCGYETYGAYEKRARVIAGIPLVARRALSTVLARWLPHRAISGLRHRSAKTRYQPQGQARYEKMLRLLAAPSTSSVLQQMHEFAFAPGEVPGILPGASSDSLAGTGLSADVLAAGRRGLLDQMMRTDFTTYLRDDILVKVDRASMAVSLECREPLLDHRLAELAFRLPTEFLLSGGEHKRVLRALAARWIGRDVLDLPKRGFVIPLYYWLRGVWKPLVLDTLTPGRVQAAGLLHAPAVSAEVARFYAEPGRRAERVWMFLNVQMWAERWLRA